MPSVAELQQRAVEYAKSGNFGPDAIDTNLQLAGLAPDNEGAWTRLARCYLESGRLDDATAATESALRLNPQNTIARSLQLETTRRRERASISTVPSRAASRPRVKKGQPAATGPSAFGRPEFAALGQLAPATALEVLGPRIETLLLALNERPFAGKAVDTRNRTGRTGARVFRRNSVYSLDQGHVYAFQHGGRWEPQLNVGFLSAAQWGRDAVRAGIGFDFATHGDEKDPGRALDREQLAASFERFQQLASSTWRQLLIDWMGSNTGFLQYGDRQPETSLLPADALAWIDGCRSPSEVGWIFLGCWLFPDRAEDAETAGDMRRLTAWVDRTFTDLLPLWSDLYRR
jgi:tetratricopeptide (TPR) repeat protein